MGGAFEVAYQGYQSAGWRTDPAFSRNRKPPALAGGRSHEQNNTGFLGKEAERLSAIRERSHACVMNLQKELEELVALLHETPNKTVERDAPQSACPSP